MGGGLVVLLELYVRSRLCAFGPKCRCGDKFVCVWSCAWIQSLCMVRSLPVGPIVGVKAGNRDARYRRGVWEPTGQCIQGGGGVKAEVNVLQPNNQHVDVFTGWPSCIGGCSMEQVAGSGQRHTTPSCLMLDEPCSPLKIARWNHYMCKNMSLLDGECKVYAIKEREEGFLCILIWDCRWRTENLFLEYETQLL